MRYRHGNVNPNTGTVKGYTNGDTDRVEMQQKFLKAVVDQKVNPSLVMKIPAIFKAVSGEIKTNFTVSDIITYSKFITDFTSASIHSYQLPGEYGHDGNGDVWIPDMDATREMVETVFGYDASGITTGNPNDEESREAGKTTRTSGQAAASGSSDEADDTYYESPSESYSVSSDYDDEDYDYTDSSYDDEDYSYDDETDTYDDESDSYDDETDTYDEEE